MSTGPGVGLGIAIMQKQGVFVSVARTFPAFQAKGPGRPNMKLIGKCTGYMICFDRAYRERASMISRSRQTATPFCSFCGKPSEQVSAMVAGPHVYICDECIGLCIAYLPLRSRLGALAAMLLPWKWQPSRNIKSHTG
jgi:hypothetical protein